MTLSHLPLEIFEDDLKFDDINWWEIVDITKIDASNNMISDSFLPLTEEKSLSFNNIPALNFLKFTNNNFFTIPSSILSLSNLKYLDFTSNKINQIPFDIGKLSALVEFNCGKNNILSIPNEIGYCKNLEVIDLCCNLIKHFPSSISSCIKLKRINMNENQIEILDLYNFIKCEEIHFNKNKIKQINAEHVSQVESVNRDYYNNLVFLDLHNNQITDISIPFCPKLDSLILGYNKIVNIHNIYNSQNLTVLDINNNKLDNLPVEIIVLTKLKTLNIQNNNINDIYPLISSLSNLVRINLEGNPLKKFNNKIRSANAEQLKAYLKTRLTNEDISLANSIITSCKEKYRKYSHIDDIEIKMDIDNELSHDITGGNREQQVNYHNYFHNNTLKLTQLKLPHFPIEAMTIPLINKIVNIDLSNNSLNSLISLNPILFPSLTAINISFNSITTIIPLEQNNKSLLERNIFLKNFFSLPNLRTLELKSNKIANFLENININQFVTKTQLQEKKNTYNFYTNNKNSVFNNEENEEKQDLKINFAMGICTSLEYLDLSVNLLSYIPNLIVNLVSLKTLILSNNNISQLDNVFNINNKFPFLQSIDLSSNRLEAMISKMYLITPNLCTLILDNNAIKLIPTDLALLQLKKLTVSGNPLKQIRMNIIQGGTSVLNDYLLKMHPFTNEEKEYFEAKKISSMSHPIYEHENSTLINNQVKIDTKISKNENTLIPKIDIVSKQNQVESPKDIIDKKILLVEQEMSSEKDFNKKRELKAKHISLIRERAKLIN